MVPSCLMTPWTLPHPKKLLSNQKLSGKQMIHITPNPPRKPLQMADKREKEPPCDQFGEMCEQPISHPGLRPCAILHNPRAIFITSQSRRGATQHLAQSGCSIFTELNTNLNGSFTSFSKIIYSSFHYSHILKYDYLRKLVMKY